MILFKDVYVLYTIYLAAPLWLLKTLRLDFQWLVVLQPHLSHCLLVIVSDLYLWRLTKDMSGKPAAKLVILLSLLCSRQVLWVTRSANIVLEQILGVVTMYYLTRLNKSMLDTLKFGVLLAIFLTLSQRWGFIWVPFATLKLLPSQSWLPKGVALACITVPLATLITYWNNWLFGREAILFDIEHLHKGEYLDDVANINRDLTNMFHFFDGSPMYYVHTIYPIGLFSIFHHFFLRICRGETPFLALFACFVALLTADMHRKLFSDFFIAIPFLLIMTAETLTIMRTYSPLWAVFASGTVIVFATYETITTVVREVTQPGTWQVGMYLWWMDPHSVVITDRSLAPYKNWLAPGKVHYMSF